MKKLLILLNLIMFFINASAQLAPVGTKWVYLNTSYELGKEYYYKFESTVLGDTVINNTIYSIIQSTYKNKTFYTKENNKIFYNYKGEKLLLFDFDVKEGDTLLVDYYGTFNTTDTLIKKHPLFINEVFYLKDTINNDSLKAVTFTGKRFGFTFNPRRLTIIEKILTHYKFNELLNNPPFNNSILGTPQFESNITFKCYTEPNGFNFKLVDDCNKVGVKNVEQIIFEIYPNPVTDFLYFKNTKTPIENISIYNVFGELVYKKNHIESVIDLQNIPTGIYFIEVKSNNEFYRQKIIKE
ncbi:MAG: T9SS type A sorting domain-containing protein [Candidatus Methylacidiphilales bacterium]